MPDKQIQNTIALKHAGVGLRFLSTLIDLIIFLIFVRYFIYYMGYLAPNLLASDYLPLFILSMSVFLYYWLAEAFLGGTLGKLALGMRVRMADGSPLGIAPSFIRNLLRIIDGLFFYLVAAVAIWFSPARQRLGDRVAGTVVVKTKSLPPK
jgi:uncharacterized RDD family membrane protein YckC